MIDEKEIYIYNENDLTIFQEWLDKVKEIEVTVSNYKNEFRNEPSIVISDFPEDINLYQLANREFGLGIPLKKTVFCIQTKKQEN